MSLVFHPEKCTGCAACQMACLDQRDIRPLEGETPLLRIEQAEEGGGVFFRLLRCTQCGLCEKVCPSGALRRDKYGLIQLDEGVCTGCGQCALGCPQAVISLVPGETAKKCDGCIGRQRAGLPPACCHTCPTGALEWKERS